MEYKERFIELMEKAFKDFQTVDHMIYVTFPLIKDKRLLFKILDYLNNVILNIINAILQYEYLYKRISLYRDAKTNFETFKKIGKWYTLSEQDIRELERIINLYKKHKQSPFEFAKNDKVVIMSDNMKTETLTIERLKEDLGLVKELLKKAEIRIRRRE